jgi:hypothetical protein
MAEVASHRSIAFSGYRWRLEFSRDNLTPIGSYDGTGVELYLIEINHSGQGLGRQDQLQLDWIDCESDLPASSRIAPAK